MSLKSRLLLALISALGPLTLKILGSTWSLGNHGVSYYHRRRAGSSMRVVYSFWHQNILPLAYYARGEGITILSSLHFDGEIIVRIATKIGYKVIRGSTTRGGSRALRKLVELTKDPSHGDIAITPDGPKGPAKRVSNGIIYLASRTGYPIVPIGVALDRCWRMKSWDRFRVPKPFSRGFVYIGREMKLPDNLSEDEMEFHRREVEKEMFRTDALAEESMEEYIRTGRSRYSCSP